MIRKVLVSELSSKRNNQSTESLRSAHLANDEIRKLENDLRVLNAK